MCDEYECETYENVKQTCAGDGAGDGRWGGRWGGSKNSRIPSLRWHRPSPGPRLGGPGRSHFGGQDLPYIRDSEVSMDPHGTLEAKKR